MAFVFNAPRIRLGTTRKRSCLRLLKSWLHYFACSDTSSNGIYGARDRVLKLNEIDKVAASHQGDPSAALL